MTVSPLVSEGLDTIERAIADIAAGKGVVVVDDEDRENEGDLIIAAQPASAEPVALTRTHCRGLLAAPLRAARPAPPQPRHRARHG